MTFLCNFFIEIINSKGKNTIAGCFHRHPCINSTDSIGIYLSELLQKVLHKDKTIMSMGDFNIEFLKYDLIQIVLHFLIHNILCSTIYLNTIPSNNTLQDSDR